jgi:hypothetical protein
LSPTLRESFTSTTVSAFPEVNTKVSFLAIRMLVRDMYGLTALQAELQSNVLAGDHIAATSGPLPALMHGGPLPADDEALQVHIGGPEYTPEGVMIDEKDTSTDYRDEMIWVSRPPQRAKARVRDMHSQSPMSRRHAILLLKDTHWQSFNVLTFGMSDPAAALEKVERLESAVKQFVSKSTEWPDFEDVGLYFNAFPHVANYGIFVHVVDLKEVTPAFHLNAYRRLPLEDVRATLAEEKEGLEAWTRNELSAHLSTRIAVAVDERRRRRLYGLREGSKRSVVRPLVRASSTHSWWLIRQGMHVDHPLESGQLR